MTDPQNTTVVIDDALAAGRPTADGADERFLQELVLAVRDDAPAADPAFERRLDARVEAGFAGSGRPRLALPALKRPRLAVLGVAASVLLALVVTVSLTDRADEPLTLDTPDALQSTDEPGDSGGAAERARTPGPGSREATDDALPAPGAEPGAGIAPLPPGEPIVPGRRRDVQRSALLTLAAPGEDLQTVADGVVSVTDRYRGFVMRSSVTAAEDGTAAGSFDLRIPVRNLRPALRDLSQLAEVRARTENADDVTASFRSARTRLGELRAQRRGLLRRLARAENDAQERAIRSQIRFVNDEIDAATRQLRDLRRRTSYAAVAVTLMADENAEDASGGGLGEGWDDLGDNLVESANIALRVLGVAIPLALVGLLTWLATTTIRRRRREAALDRQGPGKHPG